MYQLRKEVLANVSYVTTINLLLGGAYFKGVATWIQAKKRAESKGNKMAKTRMDSFGFVALGGSGHIGIPYKDTLLRLRVVKIW